MPSRWKPHPILNRFEQEISDLRTANQFRDLDVIGGINLCSNDYLGLSDDPRLRRAVIRALESDQLCSSTGSRLLSGNAAEWEKLESNLASFVGAEAALYFSSGYMANLALLSAVAGPDATVFSDSANHASLINGIRLSRAQKVIFPHSDMECLESDLRGAANGERF